MEDAYYIVEKLREPPFNIKLSIVGLRRVSVGGARERGAEST